MSDNETRDDNIDLLIPEIQRLLDRSADAQTTRLERLTVALLAPMVGARHFSSVNMQRTR